MAQFSQCWLSGKNPPAIAETWGLIWSGSPWKRIPTPIVFSSGEFPGRGWRTAADMTEGLSMHTHRHSWGSDINRFHLLKTWCGRTGQRENLEAGRPRKTAGPNLEHVFVELGLFVQSCLVTPDKNSLVMVSPLGLPVPVCSKADSDPYAQLLSGARTQS